MFIKRTDFEAQYRAYMESLAENDRLRIENARLREPAKLAREAMDRYCHPGLRETADEWMRSQGI